jgi:OPA family glycerol-3-phosphate transporter-like MFS transporter
MGQTFSHEERGVVMSWWCTCYVLGGLIATVFATWCVSNALVLPELGWRRGLWGPACALGVVLAIFLSAIPKLTKRSQTELSDHGFNWMQVGLVIRSPKIQLISVVYTVLKLTRYSFLYWLPLYMTERLRYSPTEAGYSSSAFEVLGFAGVLVAGYLSDKVFGARRFPVAALMMSVLALVCLCYPFLSTFSRLGNLVGIALIGMMTFGPDALLGGPGAQDAAPPDALATAAGFINGVGSFGQFVSPMLVVLAVENFGWERLFYLFAALALAGAMLLTLSRAERRCSSGIRARSGLRYAISG